MNARAARILAALALTGGFFVAEPSSAEAQPGVCGEIHEDCENNGNDWKHTNPQEGDMDRDGMHGSCWWCLSGGLPKTPELCHPPCGLEAFGGSREDAVAYRTMVDLAQRRDLKGVLDVGVSVPAYIAFHEQRESIQLMNCKGDIIANLSVARDAALLAAARGLVREGTLRLAEHVDGVQGSRGTVGVSTSI